MADQSTEGDAAEQMRRLRLGESTPLIEALGQFLRLLDAVQQDWLRSADSLEEHQSLLYLSRERVKEVVSPDIVPPSGETSIQFASRILNRVEEAWHLCRFVRSIPPDDRPDEADFRRVLHDMHERLPAIHDELRKAWLHLKHVASLQATQVPLTEAHPALDEAHPCAPIVPAEDAKRAMSQEGPVVAQEHLGGQNTPDQKEQETEPASGRGSLNGDPATTHEYVYRRQPGAVFEVRFQDERGFIPTDLDGACYIYWLLHSGGEEFTASALRGRLLQWKSGHESSTERKALQLPEVEGAGPAVDDASEQIAYLQKKAEEHLKLYEDAKEVGNESQQACHFAQLEAINARIKSLRAPDGTPRRTPSNDKDRVAVTTAIRLIEEKCRTEWGLPHFAEHLRFVSPGAICRYAPPDPRPEWH